MLKQHEPNPLAVFNMRRVDFCPPHFQKFSFDLVTLEKTILDWVHENTEGRFYYSKDNNFRVCLGFENHFEASYFALMLSEINTVTDLY